MVDFQEEMKYGRSSGIKIAGVDFARLAEAFVVKGLCVDEHDQVEAVMDAALAHEGVSQVDVRIDYSDARDLAASLVKDSVG